MTDKEIMEALLKGETLENLTNANGAHIRLCADEKIRGSFVSQLFIGGWRIKPKPKLTWDQALQAMREGKKVRREAWPSFECVYLPASGIFCDHAGEAAWCCANWFTATDWEIV